MTQLITSKDNTIAELRQALEAEQEKRQRAEEMLAANTSRVSETQDLVRELQRELKQLRVKDEVRAPAS